MSLLAQKKYKLIDYFLIPYKACKIPTLIIMINVVITAFIPALSIMVTNQFVNTVLDIINNNTEIGKIIIILIEYILIIIWNNLSSCLVFNFVNIRYDMGIYRNIISEIIDKRGRLEYKHIENDKSWDLINRVCEQPLLHIATGMNNLFDIVDVLIRISSVLIILSLQEWWIGIAIFLLAIPMIKISGKSGKVVYNTRKEVESINRESIYLSNVLTEKEFVDEKTIFDYCDKINNIWDEKYEKVRKAKLSAELRRIIKMRISGIVTLLFVMFVVMILLIPTLKGNMSVGMFIALVNASFSLVSMMSWKLSFVTRVYAEEQEYLRDLTEFMNLTEIDGALELPVTKLEKIESIEFKNVYFKYEGSDEYILNGISFKIENGIHYALVGINGAGKSTIIKLLTKMYDDYEGEIFINNKELHLYSLAEIKKIFNITFQDFARYQATLADNIRYGDINKNSKKTQDREIYSILKTIGFDSDVELFRDSINTHLGKLTLNSIDLSGGQWQKVAIARSLYSASEVTILDEPTAALDPIAESKIFTLINEISKDKTMLFITHRMGAAKMADKIIVIDNGKVAEEGTHGELIGLKKQYYDMYQSQVQWYK